MCQACNSRRYFEIKQDGESVEYILTFASALDQARRLARLNPLSQYAVLDRFSDNLFTVSASGESV